MTYLDWRRLILHAVFAATSAVFALPAAAADEARIALSIQAGTAADVLDQLSRATGRKIDFDRAALSKLRSKGVQGQLSLHDAMARVLEGTGATFEESSDAVRVQAGARGAGVAQLNPVVVTGVRIYSGTRNEVPVTDIPQSVQVMTQQQLAEQNSFTLGDAMNRATGVSVVAVNPSMPVFGARGFRITNIHVDSGAGLDMVSSATQPLAGVTDMGEYDRIEILRGADALFGGNGNPGGSISLIRKEPLRTNATSFNASLGSWNYRRAEADVNRVITEDGRLRARLDLVSLGNDYFFDNATLRYNKAYGTIAYDLGDDTVVTAGGSYSKQHSRDVASGLPRYPDGSDPGLPRSLGLTFPWSFYEKESKEAFVKFTSDLGGKWSVKGGLTYLEDRAQFANAQFHDPLDPITNSIAGRPDIMFTTTPNGNRQLAADVTLSGSVNAFGMPVDLLVGYDHQNFRSQGQTGFIQGYNYSTGDLFRFDPSGMPDPRLDPTAITILTDSEERQRSSGLYGNVGLHLTDALTLTLGGRYNRIAVANKNVSSFGPFSFDASTPPSHDAKFTPFAALLYKLTGSTSLYASYADIYFSNFGKISADMKELPPIEGVNTEVGVKHAWAGGRFTGTLGVFDIRQKNLPQPDLLAPNPMRNPLCCYLPNSVNKSRGFEAEVAGKITDGWNMSASYTYNDNEAKFGEVLGTFTPRHMVKLWTSYKMPAPLDRLTVGGNLLAQSANHVTGTYFIGRYCTPATPHCGDGVYTFNDVQGGYATLDLRLAYQLTDSLVLSAVVNNVGDRRFFSVIGAPYAGSTYGAPRNYMLKAEVKL